MVPVTGLWVIVGIIMSANDAMVNTLLPTAPLEPTRGLARSLTPSRGKQRQR